MFIGKTYKYIIWKAFEGQIVSYNRKGSWKVQNFVQIEVFSGCKCWVTPQGWVTAILFNST